MIDLEPATVAESGRWKRAGRIVARLAATVLTVLVLGVLAVLVGLPRLTHGAALTVLTGSMAPELPVGAVVIDRPVDPATLRVGDIATYEEAGHRGVLVTHRVVAVHATSPATFTFQGDANPVPDPVAITAAQIRGKVWFDVPYLGRLRDGLGTGRPWMVGSGVLLLGGYSAWQFAGAWRERRRPA